MERNIFWYTGQLFLSKIIKTVATSCQILRLKCTKFNFGWGSAPDPAVGAYSAPDLLAGFQRPPRNVTLIILTLSPQSKNWFPLVCIAYGIPTNSDVTFV